MLVPVSLSKLEGLSTTVTFRGILIDTARLELRLHLDKLARLRHLVASWLGRRSGRCSDLESLPGDLSHAAAVHGKTRESFLKAIVFPDGEGLREALFCALGLGSRC